MVNKFMVLRRFIKNEDAATAIEYALFGALIAAVIAITIGVVGTITEENFCSVVSAMGGAC
jgi:pilus assembly protein Flp/PilA